MDGGDLPFFLGLMEWLAARGYPSAAPVADRGGATLGRLRGKPAALVAFLPGLSVRRPTAGHCREAGEGLGWLHRAAEGFAGTRRNTLGQPTWAPLFAPLADAAESLEARTGGDDPQRSRPPRDGLADATCRKGSSTPTTSPTTSSSSAAASPGPSTSISPADDALAYDLAVALNAWCFDIDGGFNVTAARAFVEGYQRRRPLTGAERAALPILSHGAAMRFFLTRLHDWGATPPGSLVRPKDPMEYERKLAAHRAGIFLLEPPSLETRT